MSDMGTFLGTEPCTVSRHLEGGESRLRDAGWTASETAIVHFSHRLHGAWSGRLSTAPVGHIVGLEEEPPISGTFGSWNAPHPCIGPDIPNPDTPEHGMPHPVVPRVRACHAGVHMVGQVDSLPAALAIGRRNPRASGSTAACMAISGRRCPATPVCESGGVPSGPVGRSGTRAEGPVFGPSHP